MAALIENFAMTDLQYRRLAVEFVQEIADILDREGAKIAVLLARSWSEGECVQEAELENGRVLARKACFQPPKDIHDGRGYAYEAACRLLEPHASEWIEELIELVASAKAAKYACEVHGSKLTRERVRDFNLIRVKQSSALRERLVQRLCLATEGA